LNCPWVSPRHYGIEKDVLRGSEHLAANTRNEISGSSWCIMNQAQIMYFFA
jgi:hypothetical protein